MKKVILKSSIVLLASMLSLSCNKQNELAELNQVETPSKERLAVDNNNYTTLSISGGVLEFKDYEAYEALVNSGDNVSFLTDYLRTLEFRSYEKAYPRNPLEDEFLGAMLDENQIVKIGKWYIKLDLKNEKVYASAELNAYQMLLEGTQAYGVYEFSTTDDVFEYLNNTELLNAKGLFCSDPKADKKSAITYHTIPASIYSGPLTASFNVEVKYVKAGVYFALRTELYALKPYSSGNHLNYWFQLESCDYAQRCGSSVSNYSHPWITPPTATSVSQHYGREKYKFYSGTKQLKSYDFKVRGRCESTQFATPYSVYFTNWVHIQD